MSVCVCIDCVCVCGCDRKLSTGQTWQTPSLSCQNIQIRAIAKSKQYVFITSGFVHNLPWSKNYIPCKKKIASLIHFKKKRDPSLFIKPYSLWNKLPSPAPYPLLVLQRICRVIVLSLVYMACILPVHPVELTKQNVFIKNDSTQQR